MLPTSQIPIGKCLSETGGQESPAEISTSTFGMDSIPSGSGQATLGALCKAGHVYYYNDGQAMRFWSICQ